jgi:lipoprotein NlpD
MSRAKWGLFFLSLTLLLGGCGSLGKQDHRRSYITYLVKPGDTLYSISWRYGYDHREVAAWNRIRSPYEIHPGQKLVIITSHEKAGPALKKPYRARATTTTASTSQTTENSIQQPPALPETSGEPTAAVVHPVVPTQSSSRKIVWGWPAQGKLATRFNPKTGDKGLDIQGSRGQPIKAAAAGDVVYSGKGLIGYGNLIIIKHNDIYLSAYGHNRRLLVTEGQKVELGEKIAEMGSTNKDGPILHFEIRKHGKPINPLWYLPK